ncbi:RHS repeat domain-containing protein [Actinoplanes sp. NPDC049265]|uniref:RHS repeat domain-containing protein n=1 Tax=Actinoplanes sp. NPDC049265 TaxID=3363902 RepID=UPI003713B8D7
MSRPHDWWVLDLESDPAPGSCDEAEALAGRLMRFADDAEAASRAVRAMGAEAVLAWTGLSTDRFADQFGDFGDQIRQVCASHRMAADALTAYVPKLRAAQADADRALADARIARSRLEAAVDGSLAVEQPGPTHLMTAAKALAEQARQVREDAAATCAREIGAASAAGIPPRSFWDKLADGFQILWEETCESAKWVSVGTGAVVLAACAPASWLAPAVGGPMLGAALTGLAAGRGNVWGVAFGVLGGLPGVVGMTTVAGLRDAWRPEPADFAGVKVERPGPAATVITKSLNATGRRFNEAPYANAKTVAQSPTAGRVDVSTGRVLITATDLELPGELPVRLTRTHRSDLRLGQFLTDGWTSTLDMRVQVENDGPHLVLEDGTLLSYPEPAGSAAAHPRQGPDRPLSRTPGNGFAVADPESGWTWWFAAPDDEGAAWLTAITLGTHRIDVVRDGLGVPTEIRPSRGPRIAVETVNGRVIAIGATRFDYQGDRLVRADGADYDYDPAGRVVRAGDEIFGYDQSGRCVRSGDRNFVYEHSRTLVTDGAGHTTTYTLNDHRQVTGVVDPVGVTVTTQWDAQHRPILHTDARGGRTSWDYGTSARPVARTDATGGRRFLGWDRDHRPLTVTNELGQTWQFRYDAAGRPEREIDFQGRERTFGWDADGRLVRDDGIGYGYDDQDRLTEERAGDRVTRYSWTGHGRLGAAVTEGGVAVEVWRDDAGKLIAESVDGAVTGRGRTPSGVDIVWDGPTRVRVAGTELVLAPNTMRMGAFELVVERDAAGRLLAQNLGSERRDFHRAHGDVIAIEDRRERREIDRDALGRVTGYGTERYAYDPIGMLTSPATGDQQGYDAAGRLISRVSADGRHWYHEWDDAGRMTAVVTPGGARWTYRYDGLGRRVAKESARERYEFSWLGHRLVEQRHTVGSGPVRATTWVHHPVTGHVIAQVEDGRVCAVVTDEVGTPTDLFDASGERIWQRRATLWGLDPTWATPLRFPGHYRDAETGLHCHRDRYYDPGMARYLSPDRRGLRGGPNPYAYVRDPFTATGPPLPLTPRTVYAAQQVAATRAALG